MRKIFLIIFVCIVIIAIRSDKKISPIEPINDTKQNNQSNKIISISLSIIVVLLILNVYQFTKTKDDGFNEHLFIASTHNYLLIFTEFGKVFWKKAFKGGKSR